MKTRVTLTGSTGGMSSRISKRRRSAQGSESRLNKRPTRANSLSESEDQYSLSHNNAGASSSSGPDIVIHQPDSNDQSPNPPQEPPYLFDQSQTSADSSPRGRESFGFEDLSVDNVDPPNGFFLPSTIPYSLYISFKSVEEFRGCAAVDQDLPFNNSKSYQEIESKSQSYIRNTYTDALGTKDLFFRIGKCSIVGENGYRDTHALRSREDWNPVCRALINTWTTKNLRSLRLEISLDYFALQTEVFSGEPFAKTIRNEIHDLMRSANGERYIPRTEFNVITSYHIVCQIIDEDDHLEMRADEKKEFVQKVLDSAPRLLLMCVDSLLGMRCLKKLLDNGLSDLNLPLKDSHLCHPRCGADFRKLIAVQGSFMAAEFFNIGEHQDFSNHVVVPIHYINKKTHDSYSAEESNEHYCTGEKEASESSSVNPYGDNADSSAKSKAFCGSGAYSNVYRVNLDPDHHNLSKDRTSDFAVKEFKDKPQTGPSVFNRELRILKELRNYPDKHIVTHLATWTQRERYYMLFPYAECNLREYMQQAAFGEPDYENIMWLLKQLRGLAKAIKTIHNLSATEASKSTPNLAAPSPGQEKKSGWHHDLKPENILYFGLLLLGCMGSRRGTFRIADFGTGKVHTYRSGSVNTKSLNGTLTYEPPETISKGATSRPYDVWSLGCVFLELLIWAVFDSRAVDTFAQDREGRRYPGSNTNLLRDDAFWQMAEDGRVSLRKSVSKRIELLRENDQHPKWQPFIAFGEVLDLVSRMLDPDPTRRISALDLWDTLDRIYRQTKLDLKRTNGNRERASSPLPRLSLKAPDRRSPDPPTSIFASPLDTQVNSPANRQVNYISDGSLTFSPDDSPRLSRGADQRNSFARKP